MGMIDVERRPDGVAMVILDHPTKPVNTLSPAVVEEFNEKVAPLLDEDGVRAVVVVSAMSGETNRLIALAQAIQERPVPRELDALVSTDLLEQGRQAIQVEMHGHQALAVFPILDYKQDQIGVMTLALDVAGPLTLIRNSQVAFAVTVFLLIGVLVYGEEFPFSRLIGFLLVWSALAVLMAEGIVQRARQQSNMAMGGN